MGLRTITYLGPPNAPGALEDVAVDSEGYTWKYESQGWVSAYGGGALSIKTFGAASDGSTDDTAAIQETNAALSALGGGTIIIPADGPGTVIGGQVTLSKGVTLGSLMTGPFDVDQTFTRMVPTILVPNSISPPIVMASRDSGVQDVLFHYPNQIAPTSATPSVYPATISIPANSAGNRVQRVTMTNAYNGIQAYGGRHLLTDLWLGCYNNMITVDQSLDVIRVRRVQGSPFWDTVAGLSYPQTVDTWVAANKTALTVLRADGMVIDDFFCFVGNVGMLMDDSSVSTPKPSYGAGSNLRFDTFTNGVQCKSTQNPGWQLVNFATNSSGAPIQMVSGGGTQPKLRVRGGSFWGADKTPDNTAGGLEIDGIENYNPVGVIGSPVVPNSGTVSSNPYPTKVLVQVFGTPSGGSVSAIGVGPGQPAIGITQGAFILNPNEGYKLTYTGTITAASFWTWTGM